MTRMRYWTVDEARAYLPRLQELLDIVRHGAAETGRVRSNGHLPREAGELPRALAELADNDIVLRDPEVGLVDFHALGDDGVVYFLCFRSDDDDLAWCHLPEEGFGGRKPLPRTAQ